MIHFDSVKNSILLPLFFILYLIITLFSLFAVRSLVFLLLSYQPVTGIQFSILRYNFFYLCKQIFPFAVLSALLLLYIRWSRKPGGITAYILIFVVAGAVWFGGIGLFASPGKEGRNEGANPFFPHTIHSLKDADVYVYKTGAGTLDRPILAYSREEGSASAHLLPVESLELDFEQNQLKGRGDTPALPLQPVHPVISPGVTLRGFAKNLLSEAVIFEEEIYRLHRRHPEEFILFSIAVLGFFIFGSIITRISRIPLFKICAAILLFRLFFSLFLQFFSGTAGELIDLFVRNGLYHPLIGLGYPAAIFFLFTVSYYLRRSGRKREGLP